MSETPPPTREALLQMRFEQGLTRMEIAEQLNTTVARVRRWIREMKIPRPIRRKSEKAARARSRAMKALTSLDTGYTRLEHARIILGGRLIEKPGYGYYLDGRPAHIDTIIKEAGA